MARPKKMGGRVGNGAQCDILVVGPVVNREFAGGREQTIAGNSNDPLVVAAFALRRIGTI